MNAVVAVFEDWGIGANGSQPLVLQADRKFFRELTRGSCVITGRRTFSDFPGGRPLPGRANVVLSGQALELPGAVVVHSVQEAAARAAEYAGSFVIGGGSVYRQMLPLCSCVYVTKLHTRVPCDVFFPNLDEHPDWALKEVLQSGEENGIHYEMCLYTKRTGAE